MFHSTVTPGTLAEAPQLSLPALEVTGEPVCAALLAAELKRVRRSNNVLLPCVAAIYNVLCL
jgi:hypothetical protein